MNHKLGFVAASAAVLVLSGCASFENRSARIEKKAEEYRRTGAARDMAEARRMAENHYWPEKTMESDGQHRSDFFPLKRDEKK